MSAGLSIQRHLRACVIARPVHLLPHQMLEQAENSHDHFEASMSDGRARPVATDRLHGAVSLCSGDRQPATGANTRGLGQPRCDVACRSSIFDGVFSVSALQWLCASKSPSLLDRHGHAYQLLTGFMEGRRCHSAMEPSTVPQLQVLHLCLSLPH